MTHCCNDAYLVLRLMRQLEVLPLTNLCDNLWARSLTPQPSERNEFHRDGFLMLAKLIFGEKVAKGILRVKTGNGKKRQGSTRSSWR